jgi:hypothetical protein
MGTSFEEATRTGVSEPPIIPARYTFIIWALIYAGTNAYGIFQATPWRRQDPFLRRVGFPAASAMAGTSAWLVLARLGLYWLTVACVIWMFASLAFVLYEFVRSGAPRNRAERWLVVAPLSVFAGYVTAALFANLAAALKNSGWMTTGASETVWSVAMLLVAGCLVVHFTINAGVRLDAPAGV